MTDYASLLNETQLEAVTTAATHVRIIAGAGSGKTRVLTYRIAYLIEEMHVDPSRILAVTFTNKAAQEMKSRVEGLVPGVAGMLSVSTFHSFCAKFLRKEAHWIGYPASFTIFDDEDQDKLIKNIAVSLGYTKKDEIVKLAKNYIGKKKTRGQYPEDIDLGAHPYAKEKECLEIYARYEEEKSKMFAFDFDDLILKTLYILKNFERAHQKWATMFDHILVDEYQDTNDAQYNLMRMLCTGDTNIYVVGDPDQTIYTWRGANQGIILDFPETFEDCQDVILDRNYRSTKNILDASNRLIAHNKKRVAKNLFTVAEEGKEVTSKRFESAEEEADWVVSKICEIATAGRRIGEARYDNIAILYRSSYMTRPFEAALASDRVPYRIYGGLRFYQRKEVKDVFAYFRLLMNPADDVSFERIVNVPKRGIGDSTIAKIRMEAQALGMSQYSYMQEYEKHPETSIPLRQAGAIREFIAKMEAVKSRLSEDLEAYSQILKDFITDIGYYAYCAEDESVDEDRAANVNAIFDDITNYIDKNPESTFDEYLQNISLLTSQDDMNGGNCVSLMTIHVAKGLEFDNVFLICLNEGSFPSARSVAESGRDGMEEERRLAYVAMTRAKKELYMTTNSGYSYQTDSRSAPSPFFKEAGLQLPESNRYGGNGGYPSPWGGSIYGGSGYQRRPNNGPGQRKVYGDSSSSFFGDGDAISPFETKTAPAAPKPEEKKDNGIRDWKIGDIAQHEKFGEGVVVEIVSDTIIIIDFATAGKKTLLATHKFLTRKRSAGGQA